MFVKNENGDLQIGSPVIKGCVVEAEIIEQIRDKKIIVFKKRGVIITEEKLDIDKT